MILILGGLTSSGWQDFAEVRHRCIYVFVFPFLDQDWLQCRFEMYKNDKLWKGGSPDERISEQELKQPVVQQDQQQQEPGWNASQWRLTRPWERRRWILKNQQRESSFGVFVSDIWTVFWGRWMERYAGRFRIGGPSLPGSVLTLNTSFGSIFSYSVNVTHHLSKVLKSQMLWIN